MLIRRAPTALAAVAALFVTGAAAEVGTAPLRVVSINLCTDQLAMTLAAPGQLVSVSSLAQDPRTSLMADRAAAFPANHGRAEEIYLLRPDLVLASSFTTPATLSMLRRLGVPVATFEPETSLDGVTRSILQMGQALGREAEAHDMAARFRGDLAALRAQGGAGPLAATWAANGYMTGTETLSADVLRAAGFDLVAERLGMRFGASIPLETLLMTDPDAVVTGPPDGPPDGAPARADDVVRHPALARSRAARIEVDNREWICGLPQVLAAARELKDAREALERGSGGVPTDAAAKGPAPGAAP